jgi:hypothetical protein
MRRVEDPQNRDGQFIRCVQNEGYEVDLPVRRVYQVLPDPVGEGRGFLRVIDETGEDFLFPKRCFVAVEAAHAPASTILPSP